MFTIGMCNIWTMLQSTHIQSHLSQRLSTHPRNIHDMANAQNINADTICKSHKDCSVGKFCDKHYSLCDKYRTLGEPCREDSHCESNTICIYGQCEKTPKEASKGSRCNSDNDCELDMCCARRHGEKICQLKLKLGQKCYVPKGGLDYSLNQQCPCSDGLICRHSSTNNPQIRKPAWHLRCTT